MGAEYEIAKEFLDAMNVWPGYKRSVEKCLDCGQIYGRQYIPYGLGRGPTYNPCFCQLVGHHRSRILLQKHDVMQRPTA